MKLTVNGEEFLLNGKNISDLLLQVKANDRHVAVMVNSSVIAREEWEKTSLSEGDRIEVLTFAAGG